MRTRRPIAFAALLLLAGLVALDLGKSAPLNPYRAPALIALGSGQASTGAHCARLPAAR